MSRRRPRRRGRRAASTVLTVLLTAPVAAAAGEAPIGRVKTTAGTAFLVTGEDRRPAEVGEPVYQHDALETGADGSLGVVFRDESRISLGPDTRLVVDEYVYTPGQEQVSFVTRMTRGTLLFVSGLISKLSPGSTAVKTTAGILGVRGTRFLVRLEPPAD